MSPGVKSVWRVGAACVLLLGLCGCTNADWNQVARLWESRREASPVAYGTARDNGAVADADTAHTGADQGASAVASSSASATGFCHQAAANAAQHATANGFTPPTVKRLKRQQLAQCEALMAQ